MQQAVPPLTEAFALWQAGRTAEALPIIQAHASSGDPDGLFTLADMYWRGEGVEQDLSRGRALFEAASDAGQPMAVRAVTNLLSTGFAGRRDWAGALARLETEARGDHLRARMLSIIRAMGIDREGNPLSVPEPEQLSETPGVWMFRGAFTPDECDFLIFLAEPTYERSLVGEKVVPDPLRTSDGSPIHWLIEDPATHAINRRLAALTRTSVDQAEPLLILRYRPGQQYYPHVDWLVDPNPRILTALTYLNDDYEGGETSFSKTGLTVKGRKGDVLVFRSITREGEFDPLSEHAGLPVTRGTKYLASRWIRAGRHSP